MLMSMSRLSRSWSTAWPVWPVAPSSATRRGMIGDVVEGYEVLLL